MPSAATLADNLTAHINPLAPVQSVSSLPHVAQKEALLEVIFSHTATVSRLSFAVIRFRKEYYVRDFHLQTRYISGISFTNKMYIFRDEKHQGELCSLRWWYYKIQKKIQHTFLTA